MNYLGQAVVWPFFFAYIYEVIVKQEKVMRDFITVRADGLAIVFFEPTDKELLHMGLDSSFDFGQELEEMLEDNFPGILRFAEIEVNSRFVKVNCDTEEIANVVNEEMNHLIDYRMDMVDNAFEFEGGLSQEEIKEEIRKIEIELVKLRNLLV